MDAQSTGQAAEFAPHFSAHGLATPQYASGSRASSWRPPQPKRKLLERGVMSVGGFFNQSRNFICDKVRTHLTAFSPCCFWKGGTAQHAKSVGLFRLLPHENPK